MKRLFVLACVLVASPARAQHFEVAPLTLAGYTSAPSIDPKADWRDQLDLDSVDLLNFLVRVHDALGIEIPEEDYPKLSSLERCVEYLAARAGRA